jgi:hypothetical protein
MKKHFLAASLMLISTLAIGQAKKHVIPVDTTLAIPQLRFDDKGELMLTGSPTSSLSDFDFLVGNWKMYHKRLNKRLVHCKDWSEFESIDENKKILIGTANMDTYSTHSMPGPDGTPGDGKLFEGMTIRLFNPKTKLWSLYWVASNTGVLDPPQVGSFEKGVGHFFAKDTYRGKNVIVMFQWDARNPDFPVWGQAFSTDNGKTWEWNWFNVSERVK